MQYKGTLIAVSNIEKSKKFYCDLLEMKVIGDFGANVQLDSGLFLQTKDTWTQFIGEREIVLHHNAGELYYEVQNLDAFLEKLDAVNVEYVHTLKEHSWGQRVVRFYDPDFHIIEVAEEIAMVVRRFRDSGMSVEQVTVRMDVPVSYVESCLSDK